MKKSKVIYFNRKLIMLSSLFLCMLYAIYTICIDQTDSLSEEAYETVKRISISQNTNTQTINEVQEIQQKQEQEAQLSLPEYVNLPKTWKGYPVIGKIEIPKLGIEKYILEETTEEALKAAVTKTAGPRANEIGNLCIAGHNYTQTFGRLKELEIGDTIIITDTYDRKVTYQIYATYKVSPTDTTCLTQDTNGEREVTLITCTLGAIKRNIIKAIEQYD